MFPKIFDISLSTNYNEMDYFSMLIDMYLAY